MHKPKSGAITALRGTSLEETLFILMALGDERAVRATYVNGVLAYGRGPVDA
jgi:hypothetical protein